MKAASKRGRVRKRERNLACWKRARNLSAQSCKAGPWTSQHSRPEKSPGGPKPSRKKLPSRKKSKPSKKESPSWKKSAPFIKKSSPLRNASRAFFEFCRGPGLALCALFLGKAPNSNFWSTLRLQKMRLGRFLNFCVAQD